MNVSRRGLFGALLSLVGWRARLPPARPWANYVPRSELSVWDDYHDWRVWMNAKFRDDPLEFEGSDTSPIRLYCLMCELADDRLYAEAMAKQGADDVADTAGTA